jgi:uncharacterized protein YlxP (DUF503 family)
MHVGVARLVFHVPHARPSKDEHRVVRKIEDRAKARFEVSIAEVDAQDLLQKAVFGVCEISADAKVCHRVRAEVARFYELSEDAVLTSRGTESVPFGDELYESDDVDTDSG